MAMLRAGGVPGWMQYKRQLQLLPTYSTASTSFSHYRIPRPAGADPDATDGLICWGSVGNLPNPQPLPTVDFNVKYPAEFWQEKARETQRVRIQNPDDPTQHIEDDRPTSVTFDKTTAKPAAAPNTSAETPPGMSNYENVANFVPADDPYHGPGSGPGHGPPSGPGHGPGAKVKVQYSTALAPNETKVP